MSESKPLLKIIIAAGALAFLALNIWAWSERGKVERGAALIANFERRLGSSTTPEDVSRWLQEGQFRELRLRTIEGETTVSSPVAGNAENWILVLRFDGNALRSSHVGTLDSLADYPKGAPPDRVYRK